MTNPVCIIGRFCEEHGFVHGAEAEQLRKAIEEFRDQLVDDTDIDEIESGLTALLDRVDARDSLAFVEVKPRRWTFEGRRRVRPRTRIKKTKKGPRK